MIDKDLLRSVTDAALELCCSEEGLKERLLAAMRALNVVLEQRESWPGILRHRAQGIADELEGRDQFEEAIAAMDLQAARRLAERILHLYADCRAASRPDQV